MKEKLTKICFYSGLSVIWKRIWLTQCHSEITNIVSFVASRTRDSMRISEMRKKTDEQKEIVK